MSYSIESCELVRAARVAGNGFEGACGMRRVKKINTKDVEESTSSGNSSWQLQLRLAIGLVLFEQVASTALGCGAGQSVCTSICPQRTPLLASLAPQRSKRPNMATKWRGRPKEDIIGMILDHIAGWSRNSPPSSAKHLQNM